MYTFEWKFDNAEWQMSRKRFHTLEIAAGAMAEFAVICWDNGVPIECKLAKANPLPADI